MIGTMSDTADKRLLVIGDVHGKFEELIDLLDRRDIRNAGLIQVGDFGVGFDTPELEGSRLAALDARLAEADSTMYVLRGNHDDPGYFVEPGISSSGASLQRPLPRYAHIHFLPDYSVMEPGGRRILVVGGAISVDRKARVPGATYWEDEEFRLDPERLAALDLHDLWAVATHTAPDFAEPVHSRSLELFAYTFGDETLVDEAKREREALTELHRLVSARANPRYWFYGHFHAYVNSRIGDTTFVMLPELGLFEPQGSGD
ncbi:MAG: metallophosphoesterase [Chloroflexia bacterium]